MQIKTLWKEIRHHMVKFLVPTLGTSYLYSVGKTSKTLEIGNEHHEVLRKQYPHFIYVGWHEHVLTSAWTLRNRNMALLISQSRDGEYHSRLARSLGFRPIRGSSSRGGLRGFLQLAHVLRTDCDILVGADGPRGPAKQCKAGAIVLAKHSGMPIIPLSGCLTHYIRMKSWDRTIVPFPFSKLIVGYGKPIFVPEDADKEVITEYQIRVKQAIEDLTTELEQKTQVKMKPL